MRVVVCLSLDEHDRWKLAPARLHDPPWISGGIRTLHELAAAAAAAGYEAEVRGDFHGGVLAELSAAADVRVATPHEPRKPDSGDLLCVPDGIRDPTFFVRVALMESRPVYLAFAPPGLFGWSFTPGWRYVDALEVDPESVGLPEHCRAIDALGFRVWSNAAPTGGAFRSAGVPAVVIHEGLPTVPPEPPKDVDVVTVGDNRWVSLTRKALEGFEGTWRELPAMGNTQLMTELGRGRLFVHCVRVEGHSRLAAEARLMGTCCIGLASNRFAVGFDEHTGGAMAESIDDVVPIVERILGDPEGLAARRDRARASARPETDWETYVERVGHAIAAIEEEGDPRDEPWRRATDERMRREVLTT